MGVRGVRGPLGPREPLISPLRGYLKRGGTGVRGPLGPREPLISPLRGYLKRGGTGVQGPLGPREPLIWPVAATFVAATGQKINPFSNRLSAPIERDSARVCLLASSTEGRKPSSVAC